MTETVPQGRAARMQVPTTQIEHHLDPKRPIVTKTDLKGKITYANPAFVEISGYSREELIGQPHNIVRHPDMPGEAFADLWRTVRAGRPWRGRVKNRSKNGDYYWVDAYVSDLTENGKKIGYMSVRTQPQQDAKSAAEALYARVRSGQAVLPVTSLRPGRSLRVEMGVALAAVGGMALAASLLPPPWSHGVGAAAMVAAGGAYLWMSRAIREPIERIKCELRELAEANLKFDDHRENHREFSEILVALQSMKVSMRAVMSDVVSAAKDVDGGCARLNTDTAQVMQRFGVQSEGIASVAAALQQLAVSVSEISEATQRSTDHASKAIEVVSQGEQQMNLSLSATHDAVRAVDTAQGCIAQLEAAVASISAVTQSIQAIAEQTNLLALNAAIEAARAGEQGRGFAVVADEVRKLAERTHRSTMDIAGKVTEIQQGTGAAVKAMHDATSGVSHGAQLIEVTHKSLQAIGEASRGVEISSREIASMLSQQKQASQEVASTMERMSALTDENVGSFGTVTDATAALARTSSALHNLLEQFERKM